MKQKLNDNIDFIWLYMGLYSQLPYTRFQSSISQLE